MGMREKLIESLKRSPACICDLCGEEGALDRVAGVIADNLINDGVTIPVRCKDCKHWHEETGWCTKHSHFIGCDGMACHPSQSSEWKMFDQDDFCSYGERKDND